MYQCLMYFRFVSALSDFLKDTSNGGLVAVHCTHGLNRTGYLVCRLVNIMLCMSKAACNPEFHESFDSLLNVGI